MTQLYPPTDDAATTETEPDYGPRGAISSLLWLAFFTALLVMPAAVWATWKALL